MTQKFPRHIVRLLILLGLLLLFAYTAKTWLTDPSFYKYGHYRADSVPEMAARTPLFQGSAYCKTCHDEAKHDTSRGAHFKVQCEVCHGTNREHPDDGKMLVPTDTIRLCSTCHEKMPARPDRQPQIVLAEHPSTDEANAQCITCHKPHSPADDPAEELSDEAGSAAESSAMAPAIVSKCAKCHGRQGQGKRKNPALAGMDTAEFIDHIAKFKSGDSKSKKMIKYARQLSDEEIAELASYYQALPAVSKEKPPE